jgi:hypothetical protein
MRVVVLPIFMAASVADAIAASYAQLNRTTRSRGTASGITVNPLCFNSLAAPAGSAQVAKIASNQFIGTSLGLTSQPEHFPMMNETTTGGREFDNPG